MRNVIVFSALSLALASCGPSEAEVEAAISAAVDEAVAEAVASTTLEVERSMTEAIELADRRAGSADRILSPLPVLSQAEEAGLRQFLNASHLARALELGVRVTSDAARDSLVAAGTLVQLADSTDHWIVRPGTDPTHVIPDVPILLEILGSRFQERLAEIGLPAYRIEVTSGLRTSSAQARLRQSNANSAAGASSHEFGTTLDLSYAAFAPPAERPEEILSIVSPELRPHVGRIVDLTLESVSGRKSREIGDIFGEVLLEAQAEGLVLVIYEREQTVHHITVGRALAGS